jgi:aminomethyltransferase
MGSVQSNEECITHDEIVSAKKDIAVAEGPWVETDAPTLGSDLEQPQGEPSPWTGPDQSPKLFVGSEQSTPRSQPSSIEPLPETLADGCSDPEPEPWKPPECLFKSNFSALRFLKSCYFDATVRWGLKAVAPYNHMLLPIGFTSVEEECENLRNNVCLWDVAVERQIELFGKDALKLAEMLTPRPLASMKVGECRYAMITDPDGMVLNDPVVLKLSEDRYWFSIADSDLLLWIKGLAVGRGLDVRVTEAAVSPLAVQGPKSVLLMRDLFGDWVDDLKFYHFRETSLDGIPMLLARSGWSPERGYELYLQDESRGDELWEKIMEAGQKYSITPGVPNHIRRIEGGLLSYGQDVTSRHSAMELGLPLKWCSAAKDADFIGKAALKRLAEEGGPKRQVVGLEFRTSEGEDLEQKLCPPFRPWRVLASNAESGDIGAVGEVTSVCYSPVLGAHIAIATLSAEASKAGGEVSVETPSGSVARALVRKLPFMPRAA